MVNKNLSVRALDLYSDDRSDDTSRVCREQATINVSSVSPEITSDSLPETNVNSKPVVDSGGSEAPLPRLIKEKTIRDWIYDPRLYIVSGLLLVCQRNLPTYHVSNISHLRSCYDHTCTIQPIKKQTTPFWQKVTFNMVFHLQHSPRHLCGFSKIQTGSLGSEINRELLKCTRIFL